MEHNTAAMPDEGSARHAHRPPLSGLGVIELGQVISAPYAGLLLADLGADVIKVEPPEGDSARNPEVTSLRGQSATFITFNRNKSSRALNLKDPDQYEVFCDMVRGADVVIANYTPATARRLRVDPATLAELNPRLITCSIQGFRSEWPQANEPSFDLVHQALTGYMLLEGNPNDPPTRVSIPIADLGTAHFAVQGVLAALVNRHETGLGEHIEVPMFDSMLSMLTYTATMYLNANKEPVRMGSAHEYTAPWQAVRAKDGEVVVAVRSHRFWVRLCESLGTTEWLVDPRFSSNEARLANREILNTLLETHISDLTVQDVITLLTGAGVPVAPVRTVGQALDDAARIDPSLLPEFFDPSLGRIRVVANPIRFSRMAAVELLHPPALDEDVLAIRAAAEDGGEGVTSEGRTRLRAGWSARISGRSRASQSVASAR
jgi:crotonobetainyl-CoA:carnitine CoA-transferase CaiB-like acyl-CoA transferase